MKRRREIGDAAALVAPSLALKGEGDRWRLGGVLDIRTLAEAQRTLDPWLKELRVGVLDLHELRRLDTPGALLLRELRAKGVAFAGLRAEHRALLDLVCGLDLAPLPKTAAVQPWRKRVIGLGRAADDALRDAYDVIAFVGRAAFLLVYAVRHPRYLRPVSIARHIEETGAHALPIVGLLAVMISVVIGYQGVVTLRPYGAEDFTINLVAVSVMREMGVLITAIMVAGRSGSAFTAEIGVMKAREEVDALQVMGVDPMQVLVLPRLVGLVVALPLLTFFADIMGLFGGALVLQSLLDVSVPQYVERVHQAVRASDAFVGLVKAPVFAFVIAVVGCMHGLRARGSAESVGRETTRAVVKGIFLVIVLDALFSVLFERLGL